MRTRERVFGPYPHGRAWRVVVVDPAGKRRPVPFPTRERAQAYKELYEADIDRTETTVDQAIDAYEKHLREKGNKPGSYRETVRRLRRFFADVDAQLDTLTPVTCRRLYDELASRPIPAGTNEDGTPRLRMMAPDSHRNYLLEARSFLRWCVEQRWIPRNPLEGVKGQGARSHGKAQLRLDEARRWRDHALAKAVTEPGAAAALLALLMGLRASEIVGLLVRDVDDDGRLLQVAAERGQGKTRAARRSIAIPDDLQPLLRALAQGRGGTELLFGKHWRDWPREWVQRLCEEAGVPQVTAHGLRDTFATLCSMDAVARGLSLGDVAATMGHESYTTTETSYVDPRELADARRKRGLKVLDGGRKRGHSSSQSVPKGGVR